MRHKEACHEDNVSINDNDKVILIYYVNILHDFYLCVTHNADTYEYANMYGNDGVYLKVYYT